MFYAALALSFVLVILTVYIINRSYNVGVRKAQETIIESLSDGVAGLDQNHKVIMANSAFEKICGISKDKIVGQQIDQALKLYAGETVVTFEQYSSTQQGVAQTGLKLHTSQGEVPLSITLAPLQLEGKKGTLLTVHNLTQEQQLEEMKVDFVSMAAHELRTPLTAIRGYASLLQMHYSSHLEPTAKELLTRLIVSTTNLANLIDNLLSVSRIERNSMIIDTKPIDLPIILNDIFESFRPQAQTKHQNYTLTVPEQMPKVMADPFRIGQVFINLIGNAINYTPEGGVISVNIQNKGEFLEIAIQDSGEGIPPEALPRLFTKFFRVSGSLEQGSKGTGLGLYITKSIVEMHHGKIWAESTLNKGSIFTFTLPVATQEQIQQQSQAPQQDFLTVKNGQGIIVKKTNPAQQAKPENVQS
jgi:two-component system, OmpR family, phosphate regulon sensor histidine kinase PhoR